VQHSDPPLKRQRRELVVVRFHVAQAASHLLVQETLDACAPLKAGDIAFGQHLHGSTYTRFATARPDRAWIAVAAAGAGIILSATFLLM